ncbi:MAG: right-handed parallel beta-helix repeat-containing protein [Acidobacteriota bacterium]
MIRRSAFVLLLLSTAPSSFAATYYVSSSTGSDGNNGTSPSTPFATIAKVNTLALAPGDEVRFFCGDTWRMDPLIITKSGSAGAPIVFSTYPAGCGNKPLLSGGQPVSGFTPYAANVWVANLSAGANAGKFPLGLNQLFRGTARLPMGRWPNIDAPDGGYSTVESQPATTQIVDAQLPPVDWTGAVMHIKGIRWYMLNRDVVATSGTTLTLGADVQCWNGCAGWGYFLNNHLATLDAEGEWYYDQPSNRVFVYTTTAPASGEIEGSAIGSGNGSFLGAVIVGNHLQEHVTYVTIEDLRIERWFDSGITTPQNLERDENQNLVIQRNEIRDVDNTGIKMTTWVWDAANNGNGPDGWRGGRNLTIDGNVVERANHFGIDTYGVNCTFANNTVRDVARIPYLGASGMGCGTSGTNCTENGDGIRINFDPGSPNNTGASNQLQGNRIERVGMQGVDVFGPSNTLQNNVIDRACISKGDCGGIRTFGQTDLTSTYVHDVTLTGNVIRDITGNTDGTAPSFRTLFGFGIYIDNFSRDITVTNNTITGATWVGVLYQRSTGTMTGNTLYDNVASDWGSQISFGDAGTQVSASNNIYFSEAARRRTMHVDMRSNFLASNGNHVYDPYEDASIQSDDAGGPMTLAAWSAFSGLDGSSVAHWYNQAAGEERRSRIFVNDTGAPKTFTLGAASWVDLDQSPVGASITVPAYGSRILIGGVQPPSQVNDHVVGEGPGPSNPNRVRVYTPQGVATAVDFLAYSANAWGANTGSGDISSSPSWEILTGPGPGAVFGPQVRAFDRTGAPIQKVNYYAYGTLKYGVNVGTALLDSDPWHEILTGAGPGNVFGPHVRGWNFDASAVSAMSKVSYFAYSTLRYGVNVEDGDVDGDAFGEILTGPGPGQIFGAQVRGWNYDGTALSAISKINFNAFATSYGVRIAGGDVEYDGFDEIAAVPGPGPANKGTYAGFDYDGTAIAALPLYDVQPFAVSYGGRVALGDVGGAWTANLIAAPGPSPNGAATVDAFTYDGRQTLLVSFTPFTDLYGANVAAGRLGY